MLKRLKREEKEAAQSCAAFVQKAREKIKKINIKLQRLLDAYLEQDIDREEYRQRKAKLMSEKKTLEEKIINLEQKQNDWLEPFRNWINSALQAAKIARDNDLFAKKVIAKEIFGSNLILAAREARRRAQNQWAALCAAHKMALSKPRSQVLVWLYNSARTFTIILPNLIHKSKKRNLKR